MAAGLIEGGRVFLWPCGGMRMVTGQAAVSAPCHCPRVEACRTVHLPVKGVRRRSMQCECIRCAHGQTPSDVHVRTPQSTALLGISRAFLWIQYPSKSHPLGICSVLKLTSDLPCLPSYALSCEIEAAADASTTSPKPRKSMVKRLSLWVPTTRPAHGACPERVLSEWERSVLSTAGSLKECVFCHDRKGPITSIHSSPFLWDGPLSSHTWTTPAAVVCLSSGCPLVPSLLFSTNSLLILWTTDYFTF